jgi:PAS domain S-box-containing protein
MRMTLKASLAVLGLLVLLPLALLSGYSIYRHVADVQATVMEQLERRLAATAAAVNERVSRIEGYLYALALSDSARHGDLAALHAQARALVDRDPSLVSIVLVNPDYDLEFNSQLPLDHRKVATPRPEEARRVFETGQPVLSGPFKSAYRDLLIVTLGVPLYQDGRIAYVLRAVLSCASLSEFLVAQAFPPGWLAGILDAEGVVIARSQAADQFVGHSSVPELVAEVKNPRQVVFEAVSQEGITTQGMIRRLPGRDWSVAVGAPADLLFAPLRRQLPWLVLGWAAALGIGFALVMTWARRMERFLGGTLDGIRAIAAGNPWEPPKAGMPVRELDRFQSELMVLQQHQYRTRQEALASAAALAERTWELTEANEHLVSLHEQQSGLQQTAAAEVVARRQLEEALRRSETNLLTILDHTPVAIYASSGQEQTAHYINKAFMDFFGYGPEEVQRVEDWWPRAYPDPAYRQQVREEWQARVTQAIATQSAIQPMDVRVCSKDGRYRIIRWGYVVTPTENWAFGLDLTEHKEAEEALRRRTAQLQETQALAQIGRWSWDLDSQIPVWDEGLFQLFRRDPGAAPTDIQDGRRYFTPASWERIVAEVEQSLAGGTSFECDAELLREDGTSGWVLIRGRARRDTQGQVTGVEGLMQDITGRELAEAERDLFSEALRQLPQPVLLTDAQGLITYVNPAFTRLFNYPPSDLLGQPVSCLAPPAGPVPQDQANVEALVRQQGAWYGELERLAHDGSLIPVAMTMGTIHSGRDELAGMVAHYMDLRPRRTQELLVHKLSLAVEQSSESIVITDLSSRIEYVNEAFLLNTGYRREEVLGQNPRLLHSGLTPRDTFVDLWRTLSQGLSWKGEFINRRKDGTEYIESASITPLRESGKAISHYVAVKQDITEYKRLMEELERHRHHLEELVAQRTAELDQARGAAEAANRAKSQFLANMSHEIRTPLTAIVGFAESMLESGQSMDERIEAITTVIRNGRHLQSLISDILDFSKIEAERIEIEKVAVPLPALLADVRASQVRGKDQDFSMHFLPPLPAVITSDPLRIRQILVNLISNAAKFTPADGSIRMIVSLDQDLEQLMISVQDTGIGIAAQEQERLFEPFVQADASTTRQFGGTGLGLTISRALAQRLGGDIQVISQRDLGSLFVLTLGTGPLEGVPLLWDSASFEVAPETPRAVHRAPRLGRAHA